MNNLIRAIYIKTIMLSGRIFGFFYKQFVKNDTYNVCIYPRIKNIEDLSDIINRVAWWLPYKDNIKITIPVSKDLIGIGINNLKTPPGQRNYFCNKIDHIQLKNSYEIALQNRILLNDEKRINDFLILFSSNKVAVIDKSNAINAGTLAWESTYRKTISQRELSYYDDLSNNNFIKMCKEYANYNKAYCFATGPSFELYKDIRFEDNSIRIICNSAIRDNFFLNHIKGPSIVAFMDRIGFFSPSEFAATFRDKLIEINKKYKPYIVTKIERVPLLLSHYPDLKHIIIGLKTKEVNCYNIPASHKLEVKDGRNILTTIMIPVASALSERVFILGADGINFEDEDLSKATWNHSDSTKHDLLEKNSYIVHPRSWEHFDYKKTYREHNLFLNNLLLFGESKGVNYKSLAPSYVPALQERFDSTLLYDKD